MIIHSSKANKPSVNLKPVKTVEIKPDLNDEVVPKKKKNKKVTPVPVVEEPVVEVVEEDKIDLSEWLKEENIED